MLPFSRYVPLSETASLLAELNDPRRYVRLPARDVFDAHIERNKAGDIVRSFRKADLEEIAANCNERSGQGSLCPLTRGHTDPDEKDESKQPPIMGYAKDYRVEFSKSLNRWVIRADFYIRKDRYEVAKEYPRVSVELWPGSDDRFFDPIALLKRTPQRSLGQWIYAKPPGAAGRVVRYSMADKSGGGTMNDEDVMPPEDETPDLPPEGGEAEPSHEEKAEQFMKHIFSHPDAQHFCKHYAMPAEEPSGEDLPPEEPSPEAPPDAAAPPAQYGAFPSATNGAAPDPVKEKERFAKAADQRRSAELMVKTLESEHIVFDRQRELSTLVRMPKAEQEAHAEYMRAYYQKMPVGSTRIPTARTPAPAGKAKPKDVHEMSREQMVEATELVARYEKQGKAITFEQAAKKVMGLK